MPVVQVSTESLSERINEVPEYWQYSQLSNVLAAVATGSLVANPAQTFNITTSQPSLGSTCLNSGSLHFHVRLSSLLALACALKR